jgi:FADH2 O2-dependent halogenase
MSNFPVFIALTLLYFAAASFSEAARRLGKAHLAPAFLLWDDPVFGPASRSLIEHAREPLTQAESQILIAIFTLRLSPSTSQGWAGLSDATGIRWRHRICWIALTNSM